MRKLSFRDEIVDEFNVFSNSILVGVIGVQPNKLSKLTISKVLGVERILHWKYKRSALFIALFIE